MTNADSTESDTLIAGTTNPNEATPLLTASAPVSAPDGVVSPTSSTVSGADAQIPNPADQAASIARSGIPTEVLATLQAALQPVVADLERQLESYDATIKEWIDDRIRGCIADFAHRVEARFTAHDQRITANTGALVGAGIAVQGQPPVS